MSPVLTIGIILRKKQTDNIQASKILKVEWEEIDINPVNKSTTLIPIY